MTKKRATIRRAAKRVANYDDWDTVDNCPVYEAGNLLRLLKRQVKLECPSLSLRQDGWSLRLRKSSPLPPGWRELRVVFWTEDSVVKHEVLVPTLSREEFLAEIPLVELGVSRVLVVNGRPAKCFTKVGRDEAEPSALAMALMEGETDFVASKLPVNWIPEQDLLERYCATPQGDVDWEAVAAVNRSCEWGAWSLHAWSRAAKNHLRKSSTWAKLTGQWDHYSLGGDEALFLELVHLRLLGFTISGAPAETLSRADRRAEEIEASEPRWATLRVARDKRDG